MLGKRVFDLWLLLMFFMVLPFVAFAQEGAAPSNPMDVLLIKIGIYSALILAVIEVAKRVAEIVPGKKDDEIVGIVAAIVRRVIDFVAGRGHGQPNDPSLIKRE